MIFVLSLTIFWAGCNTIQTKAEAAAPALNLEALWIRNGEPIVFEKESWYPQDDIESYFDNELYILGKYQGVEFYVEKMDVRPYNRLYTKFGKNKYRLFEKNQRKKVSACSPLLRTQVDADDCSFEVHHRRVFHLIISVVPPENEIAC